MRIGEIISENAPTTIVINISNGQAQVEPTTPTDDGTSQADGMMIPPLQAKLELVKKLAGEESIYDPEESECEQCGASHCECDAEDPMAILKRNAGLSPLSAIVAEDEPFEG
jgi:hypothetical protein